MRWLEGARALLAEARRHKVPTILDADIAPTDALREMITLADHVLFSEPALLSLTASGSPREALVEIATELKADVVGVTLGAAGSLIWQRSASAAGTVNEFPSIPIRAADTLNAGDVWHGTYVYGLVNNWGVGRAAQMANVAAAMKCEHFGGRLGSPRFLELLERSRTALPDLTKS
jgi:sulfofructose kinase